MNINTKEKNTFYRSIANTAAKVSVIGLGTVKLGRNTDVKYPNAFNIPTDSEASNLLSLAKDLGINLLDTAPAYGNSEARLGNLLKSSRKDWIISSKAGENFTNGTSSFDFTKKGILKSVHNSLHNLKTDYLDILLIHSNGEDESIINNYEVFNTLDDLKQQGLIRFSGMSTKTVNGGILTLQHSDIAMITYNLSDTNEHEIITIAKKLNKAIFIKKGLASGHLDKLEKSQNTQDINEENISSHKKQTTIESAFNFILGEKAITSIIVGTINPKHLEENVKAAFKAICTFSL